MSLALKTPAEIWKPILGYEGRYFVSNRGRIKSCYGIKSKILKQGAGSSGYLHVVLCVNNVKKTIMVHRLVGKHFKLNSKNKREINHKNRNKRNNFASNLEWSSPRENSNYHWKIKTKSSRYTGVSWSKRNKRWEVRINVLGRSFYLGRFFNDKKAANVYKQAKLKVNSLPEKHSLSDVCFILNKKPHRKNTNKRKR